MNSHFHKPFLSPIFDNWVSYSSHFHFLNSISLWLYPENAYKFLNKLLSWPVSGRMFLQDYSCYLGQQFGEGASESWLTSSTVAVLNVICHSWCGAGCFSSPAFSMSRVLPFSATPWGSRRVPVAGSKLFRDIVSAAIIIHTLKIWALSVWIALTHKGLAWMLVP